MAFGVELMSVWVLRHSFSKPGGKDGVKVVWLERAGPDPNQKKRLFEDLLGDGEVS